ncbi:flagellar biosynthetic protein FlhB [Oleiphilus sp. HI0009]|nr:MULTISPECIES: flagellar biosynthesis protein FlhB [unclassified Oleiphilus]KZX76989.1 flagellar biosynthetic protein FlhB [Oleiphilus sp. HI0009]KZY66116.1 flagellar biosynthetic protein FlhB [Oleiphilus sp. HI0066]KZY70003.1 flagellar biosynthetic protein FlhB [Oleiphilus sp. HI0067]
MAEEGNDSSQEKTEEPTPRRIEKAKEEGQVARSKELNTALLLIVGTGGLLIFGAQIGETMVEIMKHSFVLPREVVFDSHQMGLYLLDAAGEAMLVTMPLMVMLFIAAIAGSIVLGGWLIAPKAVAPKFSRMNPLKGLKRMFSLKSLVELAKAIAKVGIVLFFAVVLLQIHTEELLGIANQATVTAMAHAADILGWSFFFLSCTMIIIAAVDVPFQMYDHNKNLKMTKQEVKDEFKDTEGKPEVKGRVRQLQREISQRRMMQDVPQADVIITNPEHYSVALRYKPDQDDAPIVLAMGVDEVAMKIREIGREHNIELVAAPPLARSIYYNSKVGEEVPSGLYVAVAQVLAYVFQLQQFRRRARPRPSMPDIPIPDDLQHD